MKKPKVSILIPTYNRAKMLQRAIKSALSQSYPNVEVVVSDNASTDRTQEVIKTFLKDKRFRYFKNKKNLGMIKNWKKLLFEYCKGKWFILLPDDDYLIDKNFVSEAMEEINKTKDISIVHGKCVVLLNGRRINKYGVSNRKIVIEGTKQFLSVMRENYFPHLSSTIFNTAIAKKVNAFKVRHNNISWDYELYLKSYLEGSVLLIDKEVSIITQHKERYFYSTHRKIEELIERDRGEINAYNEAKKKIPFILLYLSVFKRMSQKFLSRMIQARFEKKTLKTFNFYLRSIPEIAVVNSILLIPIEIIFSINPIKRTYQRLRNRYTSKIISKM